MKKILSIVIILVAAVAAYFCITERPFWNLDETVDITSQLPYDTPAEIECCGDYILLKQCKYHSDESYDMTVTIYNKKKQSVHAERHFCQSISDYSTVGFMDNGCISISDPDSMLITVLDNKLNTLYYFDYSGYKNGYDITAEGSSQYFFAYDEDDSSVIIANMETQEEKVVRIDGTCFGLYGVKGNTVVASTDIGNAIIDFANPSDCRYVSSEFSIYEDRFFKRGNGSVLFSSLYDTDRITMLSIDNKEHMTKCSGDMVITEKYGEDKTDLKIYDIGSKQLVNSYAMETLGSSVVALGSDYAVMCYTDIDSSTRVIIWNYLQNRQNLNAQVITSTYQELKDTSLELAVSLETKYGVEVVYGPDTEEYCAGYRFENEEDTFSIYNSLKSVERCLSRFPDGMLKEIKGSWADSIKIRIVERIFPVSRDSISDAGALTYVDNGSYYVILTTGSSVYSNLAHELMHVMFYRIEDYVNQGGEDFIQLWRECCTPEDFEYNGAYHDSDGREYWDCQYTVDCDSSNDVWFIDAYSKTFVSEDFARTYEYLLDSEEELDSCFRYQHLYEKAQYLCAIIREVFPSVKQSDKVYWERLIKPVETSRLSGNLP